jgi:hypothetical protein
MSTNASSLTEQSSADNYNDSTTTAATNTSLGKRNADAAAATPVEVDDNEVGIVAFMDEHGETPRAPFDGSLKERYTDFIVHEANKFSVVSFDTKSHYFEGVERRFGRESDRFDNVSGGRRRNRRADERRMAEHYFERRGRSFEMIDRMWLVVVYV